MAGLAPEACHAAPRTGGLVRPPVAVREEPIEGHDRGHAEFLHLPAVAAPVRRAPLHGVDVALAGPLIFAAAWPASGTRPAMRHLISKNFSAPKSAPKPASV